MNLIGKFKLSFQGNQYTLTVIHILRNYTLCIPMYTKDGYEMVHASLVHIYSKCGRSHKVFPDSGTKFNKKLVIQVASASRMKQVFRDPCYP